MPIRVQRTQAGSSVAEGAGRALSRAAVAGRGRAVMFMAAKGAQRPWRRRAQAWTRLIASSSVKAITSITVAIAVAPA